MKPRLYLSAIYLTMAAFSLMLLAAPQYRRLLSAAVLTVAVAARVDKAQSQPFQVEEATIAEIHASMKAGKLTCHALVQKYLDRIEAYDKQGPALNSIITINPRALQQADELDSELARRGLTRPLQCIPVIVKDNFNTAGLETTAGSAALAGSIPPSDAFQVKRVREAGAIVLAKANLSEFAASGVETVSSRLPGYTKNPYALDRVTAGSSGGTAAAVSANFGAVGLGSDTEDSIRGPSSHTSLVGIRSTMGLTSRSGIVPLDLDRDIGGPMARTVADAVAVLDVIAGPDPADPVTLPSKDRMPPQGYAQFLLNNGLRGVRIGVLRFMINPKESDPDVVRLFDEAVADLKAQGAELVDPLPMPELEQPGPSVFTRGEELVWTRCSPFKFQLRDYLAGLGPNAPVHDLEEIIKSGKYHPSIGWLVNAAQAVPRPPHEDPACEPVREGARAYRSLITKAMADHKLDALAYPSWSIPPRLTGDLNTPDGMNSGRLASPAAFPAITVPMGYARGFLPVGLEFLGIPWSEPTLIKLAYSYEQATKHRRPPPTTPPLSSAR
jgi:Asp-tRNA(Asn)/Glu-tRNA(Gln) amidotransferase A subunit family amidase